MVALPTVNALAARSASRPLPMDRSATVVPPTTSVATIVVRLVRVRIARIVRVIVLVLRDSSVRLALARVLACVAVTVLAMAAKIVVAAPLIVSVRRVRPATLANALPRRRLVATVPAMPPKAKTVAVVPKTAPVPPDNAASMAVAPPTLPLVAMALATLPKVKTVRAALPTVIVRLVRSVEALFAVRRRLAVATVSVSPTSVKIVALVSKIAPAAGIGPVKARSASPLALFVEMASAKAMNTAETAPTVPAEVAGLVSEITAKIPPTSTAESPTLGA